MEKQVLESDSLQLSLRAYDASVSARTSLMIGSALGVRQDCHAPFAG